MVLGLGLTASVLIVMLSFTIKQQNIVKLSALLGVITFIQYMLLSQPVAASLSAVSFLYAGLMLLERKIPFSNSPYKTPVLLLFYSVVFFSLNGFEMNIQLLAYVGSICMVAVMLFRNPFIVKWLMVIAGVSWSIYQFYIGAYGQLIGQVFYFVGVFYSLALLYKMKFSGQKMDSVPEITDLFKKNRKSVPAKAVMA